MKSFYYKKIIGVFLAVAVLALFLPLDSLHAQRTEPPETGDDNIIIGQPTTGASTAGAGTAATPPTAEKDSVFKALQTAACPVINSGVLYYTACGLLTAGAWIIFVILMAVSAFFALFGNLFDIVTAVTLNPDTYSLPAIYNGWIIVRDTANLFFIFILLTIAIATILQIDTYGAKKLLPKLIIAALFINFSFLLTQYVIFSANLMTGFFLPGAGTERGPSSQLSVKFLAGINPNAMYKGTQFNLNAIAETQKKLQEVRTKIRDLRPEEPEEGDDLTFAEPDPALVQAERDETQLKTNLESQQKELPNTLVQLIVAMLGVIAFIVVATGALAFAGISLLIRVVVLWFLMILSPAAFLFYVVPGLSSHAKQWWDTLIKQAFFPVAFFFLFGLTVQMISTPQARGLFENAEKVAQQAGAGAINTALIVNFTAFAYYALLIIMLLASVIVAKQMGGVTAQWAEKGYQYAKGATLGYAGRTSGRAIGRLSEKLSTEENRGALVRGLSVIPGGRMMAGAMIRTLEKGKKLGGLEDVRKGQLEAAKLLSPTDRATYAMGLAGSARENLMQNMSDAEVAEMLQRSPQHRDTINASIARLGQSKQAGIRLEQFKLTPENERGQLFSSLAESMRESFIREKLSARDIVSLLNDNNAVARQATANALDAAPAERQEKVIDEFNKFLQKLDNAGAVQAFERLPNQYRGALFDVMKPDELQKVALNHELRGVGPEFITALNASRPQKVNDALKSVPHLAYTLNDPTKTFESLVRKIDFMKVTENILQNPGHIQNIVEQALPNQIKDIYKRGGRIEQEFERRIQEVWNNVGQDINQLALYFERAGNVELSNALRRNPVMRQMLGLRAGRAQPPQQPPPPPPQQQPPAPPAGGPPYPPGTILNQFGRPINPTP